MKTKIIIAVNLLIVLGMLIEGCKKDANIEVVSKSANKHRSTSCCEGVNVVCDNILEFQDTAHFREVYECLLDDYETWNDAFTSTYSGLDETALNEMADSLGFDEEETLINFESCLDFASLRANLRTEEDAWLNNTVLDFNNDPDDDVPTDDPIMLTLLNRFGEVIIGGVYYRYYSDGTVLELTDYKCKDIETLRDDTTAEVSGTLRRVTFGGADTDECTAWKRVKGQNPYTSGKIYKYKVRIRNFLINCTVSSVMTSYKQKPNGKWRKWKASLSCNVQETLYNNSCGIFTTFYNSKTKKRKQIIARYMVWDPHIFRTKKNKIWGEFTVNGSSYQILYLTW